MAKAVVPQRKFSCDDEMWNAINDLASHDGVTASELVRRAVEAYLKQSGREVPTRSLRPMSRSARWEEPTP